MCEHIHMCVACPRHGRAEAKRSAHFLSVSMECAAIRDVMDDSESSCGPARVLAVRRFVCGVDGCKKSFGAKCHLNRHMLSHAASTETSQCKICDRVFGRNDALLRHVRAVHEKDESTLFQCRRPGCASRHRERSDLQRHEWRCTACKCPTCGETFKTSGDLARHMLTTYLPDTPLAEAVLAAERPVGWEV